jgi:NitT/TauT family transport system substrate-binding protein
MAEYSSTITKHDGISADRRRLLGILGACTAIGALSGLGIAACSRREPQVRIASNVWPGYEFLYLARSQGYYDPAAVRLVEMPSATSCIQALAAGTIEGVALTLDEVLSARAEGLELRVITVLDISLGADALLARRDFTQIEALKGRRIGVEQSAVGAVMLDAALRHAGLTPADVQTVYLTVNQHRDAFVDGKVDAVITFEPVVRQLTVLGANSLFDSSMVPGRIMDVLAVLPQAAAQSPLAIRQLVAGHFRALEYYHRSPIPASDVLALRLQIPATEVPPLYTAIKIPDVVENRDWLGGSAPKLNASAAALAEVMRAAQLLPDKVDLADLTDDRFLPRG